MSGFLERFLRRKPKQSSEEGNSLPEETTSSQRTTPLWLTRQEEWGRDRERLMRAAAKALEIATEELRRTDPEFSRLPEQQQLKEAAFLLKESLGEIGKQESKD